MAGVTLATRADFEKAQRLILRFFESEGIATRRSLSTFKGWGVTYEAIELAIRYLRSKGIIEELYPLPDRPGKTGNRKEYFGLTSALDAMAVELPEGIVRESRAFQLIADAELELT